jgi:hypothetical protein
MDFRREAVTSCSCQVPLTAFFLPTSPSTQVASSVSWYRLHAIVGRIQTKAADQCKWLSMTKNLSWYKHYSPRYLELGKGESNPYKKNAGKVSGEHNSITWNPK